jgi:hypothetical protein
VSVEPMHLEAEQMYGAIIRARKPLRVRPSQ